MLLKRIYMILIFLIVLFIFPLSAHAAVHPRRDYLEIVCRGLPDNVMYLDVLAPMDSGDPAYTPKNTENLRQLDLDTSGLVGLNSDGYVSVSAHYDDILTKMELNFENEKNGRFYDSRNTFVPIRPEGTDEDKWEHQKRSFMDDMTMNYKTIKVILLDKDGNIVKESQPFSIEESETKRIRDIEYYVSADYIDVRYDIIDPGQRSENTRTVIGFLLMVLIFIILIVMIFVLIFGIVTNIIKKKQTKR